MVAAFDFYWFHLLNGWLRVPGVALFFYWVAQYGITLFLLLAIWLWYTPHNAAANWRHKKAVVLGGLAVLLTLLFEQGVDLLAPRPRPYLVYPDAAAFNVLQDTASFPSMHVAVTFAFAVILGWMGYRRLAVGAGLLALLIGLSRVVTGVHYPTDILAGLAVGAGAAWLVNREAGWLRQFLPVAESEPSRVKKKG